MYADQLARLLKTNILMNSPVMVHGKSGIGKSSIIRQVAKEIGQENEIDFGHIDIRLSQMEPSDLRGILWPSSDGNESRWLPPSCLPQDPEWTGVIVLDEINNAPALVQAAAYQLVLDRRIGDYILPDGAAVVAAGNLASDKGVYFAMPAPLANRMKHFTLTADVDKWKECFAYKNKVHPDVIGFVTWRKELFHKFDANVSKDHPAFPTPRTWELVSNSLNEEWSDQADLYEDIKGSIGDGTAGEFFNFRKIKEQLVPIETVMNPDASYDLRAPDGDVSIYYAMTSTIIHHFIAEGRTPNEGQVTAIYNFLNKINREEIRLACFKDMTGAKMPIVAGLKGRAAAAKEQFYHAIKDLIPDIA
jgi:hypothetical protein